MATILFLTATYIKEYTPIDPNVDEKVIRIAIEEAQKVHIRKDIGSGLYDEIVTQINGSSLSSLNTTLLDSYIIPALKWWTLVEVAPYLQFRMTNKNITKKYSENSSSIDYNELDQFMSMITDKAQYHSQRLIDYLCANDTSYPLYINPGTTEDTIYPRTTSYDSGIYLGGTRKITTYEQRFEK